MNKLTRFNYDNYKLPNLVFTQDYSVKNTSLFLKGEEYPPYMYNYERMIDLYNEGIIEIEYTNNNVGTVKITKTNKSPINFLIRLVALVPWCSILLIVLIRDFITNTYWFIKYGGEVITYINSKEKQTIAQTLRELIKQNDTNKTHGE